METILWGCACNVGEQNAIEVLLWMLEGLLRMIMFLNVIIGIFIGIPVGLILLLIFGIKRIRNKRNQS